MVDENDVIRPRIIIGGGGIGVDEYIIVQKLHHERGLFQTQKKNEFSQNRARRLDSRTRHFDTITKQIGTC